ncbi:hypothetical protein D3OALGA1CA_3105 [Olavius algarvensis associated proteobacterium Delta 3]|nr:hypothetical protein D3OALGA1CA_3105 [Olavius algarvensis associated proteobacterium Delta 3]CAB5158692.1 hypothetical protein D3OALGB2SA_5286 [Olavius algarvensis associated proteobacterium Delta 3]
MRESLLELLVCPSCAGQLTLSAEVKEGEEIVEGRLDCACKQVYPVVNGVPRMLSPYLRVDVLSRYARFFETHRYPGWDSGAGESLAAEREMATMDRFGYEWKHFSDYNCDNFSEFVKPLPERFLEGKLGLDVGCGAGRHAGYAYDRGAEIVDIDLSPAVDVAQERHADKERVHFVQADMFALPFAEGTFDFIYSLGVLQHTVDPKGAYLKLVRYLRPAGAQFVWIYAHATRKVALELLRVVSQRLSNEGIQRMSFLCNLIDYGIFVNGYRVASRLPVLGGLARQYAPLRLKEYSEFGYRVSYTDWFDRLSAPITNYYREADAVDWLRDSGLTKTEHALVGDSWWWLYGEKKSDS